jgi:mannosyltransferase OCH1-like enzyme
MNKFIYNSCNINNLLLILITIICIIIIYYLTTSLCNKYIKYNKNENFYTNNENRIPLKIYQTFHTKDLPPKIKECVETLKNQNPEFEHYLFDDDDCRNFIIKNFDEKVLNAYDSLIPGAYKADLWRLCILYKMGGIYIDIKYKCADDIKLIDFTDKEYFVEDYSINTPGERGVYNGFMICHKENPILIKAINRIVSNVEEKYYGMYPTSPTGPGVLGKIFTDDDFNKTHFQYIYIGKDWNLEQSDQIINKTDNKVILIMFPEYRQYQLKNKDKHYQFLWFDKKIYR